MLDKTTFEYTIIRVVPKVERQEFMNVGVLVFSKSKRYLGIKYLLNEKRLMAFSVEMDLELLKQYLKAWELICQGGPAGGTIGQMETADRFRWLSASKSTILQCSKTHSGLCDDPEKVLIDAFERYVL